MNDNDFPDDATTLDFSHEVTLCSWTWPGCTPCTRPGGNTDEDGHAVCHVHRDPMRQEPEETAVIELRREAALYVALHLHSCPGEVARGLVFFEHPDAVGVQLRRVALDVPAEGYVSCEAIVVDAEGRRLSPRWKRQVSLSTRDPAGQLLPAGVEHQRVIQHQAAELAQLEAHAAVQSVAHEAEFLPALVREFERRGVHLLWLARELNGRQSPWQATTTQPFLVALHEQGVSLSLLHLQVMRRLPFLGVVDVAQARAALEAPTVPMRPRPRLQLDSWSAEQTQPVGRATEPSEVIAELRARKVDLFALWLQLDTELSAHTRQHGPPDLTDEDARDPVVQQLVELGRKTREEIAQERQDKIREIEGRARL